MYFTKSNLSLIAIAVFLCGFSLTGCSDDDPRLSPEQTEGAIPVKWNPDGGALLGAGLEFGVIPFHDNECRVLGFTDDESYAAHVDIPAKLLCENQIYKVVELGERSFNARKNLFSVVISEGISKIEYASFKYCTSLSRVTLPKSMREIEEDVFYECTNLKEINLPEGLESIGIEAFTSCYKLDEVTLPSTIEEIGEYAFTNCYLNKLVCLAKNPPEFEYSDANYHYPDFLRIGTTPIYVPRESLQLYMDSEWGKTYPDQIFPL